MVQDPYSVLGVSRDATQDEIKKAYRQKAKQYHPDFHPDDPTAAARMNEINEAYDMLTNPDKYKARQSQQQQYQQSRQQYGQDSQQSRYSSSYSSSQGGWSSDFGFDFSDFFGFGGQSQSQYDFTPRYEANDSTEVRSAINAINSRRFTDSQAILSRIVSAQRNARWYYLMALATKGQGNTARAIDMITKAIQMDPENRMYQALLQSYRYGEQTTAQSSGYTNTGFNPFRRIFRIFSIIIVAQILLGVLMTCFSSGSTTYTYYRSPNGGYYYYGPYNRN